MAIIEKARFREMWLAGKFGNKPRHWQSYQEIIDAGYTGNVSFRIHTPDSKHTRYGVPVSCIPVTLDELTAAGVDPEQVWFNESAPDDRLVLQGEYFDGQIGPMLFDRCLDYSRAKTQMKTAMRLPLVPDEPDWMRKISEYCDLIRSQTTGLQTEMLLKSVMNENSWEDFNELRLLYPGHIIEFSVYDHCVGDCPHRNTLIWEVRLY